MWFPHSVQEYIETSWALLRHAQHFIFKKSQLQQSPSSPRQCLQNSRLHVTHENSASGRLRSLGYHRGHRSLAHLGHRYRELLLRPVPRPVHDRQTFPELFCFCCQPSPYRDEWDACLHKKDRPYRAHLAEHDQSNQHPRPVSPEGQYPDRYLPQEWASET